MKYAYYCPVCNSFWQYGSASAESVQPCATCGAAPLFTGYSVDQWKLLSPAEKEVVINALACRAQTSQKEEAAQTAQGFSWTGALRVLSWLSFAGTILIGIVLAIFAADNSDFGAAPFLIVVSSIILAFCSVAVMMVFLGAADDLRAIRKKMDA